MAAEFTSFAANWRGGSMQHDLWRYACELYARPGMEGACLQAQAKGTDVCMALCAFWLDARGVAWSAARAARLQDITEAWSGPVIEPLRALRQQWRNAALADPGLAHLREGVKRLELEAEQALLERLGRTADGWCPQRTTDARWVDWAVADTNARLALRTAAGRG